MISFYQWNKTIDNSQKDKQILSQIKQPSTPKPNKVVLYTKKLKPYQNKNKYKPQDLKIDGLNNKIHNPLKQSRQNFYQKCQIFTNSKIKSRLNETSLQKHQNGVRLKTIEPIIFDQNTNKKNPECTILNNHKIKSILHQHQPTNKYQNLIDRFYQTLSKYSNKQSIIGKNRIKSENCNQKYIGYQNLTHRLKSKSSKVIRQKIQTKPFKKINRRRNLSLSIYSLHLSIKQNHQNDKDQKQLSDITLSPTNSKNEHYSQLNTNLSLKYRRNDKILMTKLLKNQTNFHSPLKS